MRTTQTAQPRSGLPVTISVLQLGTATEIGNVVWGHTIVACLSYETKQLYTNRTFWHEKSDQNSATPTHLVKLVRKRETTRIHVVKM